ncbi:MULTISPECIES: DUF3795 domain-containing protein [unclassified Maridesulfovibrio]|uniref:DUF3795 domain-containing protein n=1 Tax=unclassified Maridesulfovibrio TaxID=2794999 RepID=UPI003B3D05D7
MTNISNSKRELIAPCGLDCSRCVGCTAGTVSAHAQRIKETLGDNFHTYAERLSGFNPAMKNYLQFRELLESLSSPHCDGCRSENRKCLPQCNVSECAKENNCEFCFECSSFPDCGKTGLPEALLQRWQDNNNFMKQHGVDKFIKTQDLKPRYP